MKRRLVFFGMLMCTLLGIFGCSKDPYKDMRLELTNKESEVQLFVEQTYSQGQYGYIYDTYNLDVQVTGVGNDVSKDIQLSGGEEFVKCSFSNLGIGKHRVAITPLSYDKTGKFTLVIKTMEGNKSLSVDFKIDLKIASFDFKSDSLSAVVKGGQIDLTDIDKYISFSPKETSQKDIKFEVVAPDINGYIEGRPDYTYEPEEYPEKYAEVKDGILKTYSGKGIVYPKLYVSSTIDEEPVAMQVVTLKASYVGVVDKNEVTSLPPKFIDIFVVDNCDNVELRMEAQKNGEDLGSGRNSFALTKNADGEYDVTLINPQFGVNNKSYDEYFIKRSLLFDFGAGIEEKDEYYNPDNYKVLLSPEDNAPNITNSILTLSSGIDNSFIVEAVGTGKYTHRFKIDHKDERFKGIIETEIVVNFNVINLPTQITVNNGQIIKQNDTNTYNNYTVFKNYGNALGTKFEIKMNNAQDFKYFVYVKEEESDLVDNLELYKSDGSKQIFGKCVSDETSNYNVIVSSAENGLGYSLFSNNESFYLRQTYDVMPEGTKQIYVGVMYSVASNSYSDFDKSNYFVDGFIEFPINLSFERGIENIEFSQSKYMLDVTNSNLSNGVQDENGILLFSLASGQKLDRVIDLNDLTYDRDLITVYPYYNEDEDVYSFYLKSNTTNKTGTTTLFVRTKNNVTTSVNITAFIPTIYAENIGLPEEEQMPLGVSFDADDALYYFTGKSSTNPHDKYTLYKTFDNDVGVEECGIYDSLQRLFMINSTHLDIKFYDYLVTKNGISYTITPIDITNNVKVTFNFDNYAKFENGRLSVFKITKDKSSPIIMNVKYTGGYIADVDGVQTYYTFPVELNVELYIYLPLQGVEVKTPKNVDIYVEDSLGYVDKDSNKDEKDRFSEKTIESTYIPNEIDLGADWNNDWFSKTNIPVNLYYDIEQTLNSPVRINGVELMLYGRAGNPYSITTADGSTRGLVYGDLFYTSYKRVPDEGQAPQYNCFVKCRISDEFKEWFRDESGYNESEYDWFLINKVFSNNITMSVNVYITQFSKLQNINNVKFNAKYATKSSDFSVDVANDGVYFEKRPNQTLESVNIAYSLNTTNAINKKVMLIDNVNSVFRAEIVGGVIKITPINSGVAYLTVTPEDNVKDFADDKYTYYNNSLVQTFRVKVADGSIDYPFEIKSVGNYETMLNDIEEGNNTGVFYNYVLTNNINISRVNRVVDIKGDQNKSKFTLNGKFSYYRNGIEYKNIYSLSGLNIKYNATNLTKDVNLGLFGSIANVNLYNLDIINSTIEITLGTTNEHVLNVGLLAGEVLFSTIQNVSVQGAITLKNASTADDISTLNIGGMFGYISDKISGITLIKGLPAKYIEGYSSSSSNANVKINYSICTNPNASGHKFNVGGLVGQAKANIKISSVNVSSTIQGSNYESNVGTLIGLASTGNVENVIVYPSINILNNISSNKSLNVSTFVGNVANDVHGVFNITSAKVYYAKDSIEDWQQALGVVINTPNNIVNFGSYVGSVSANRLDLFYSYVRSFYNENNSNYYGDICVNSANTSRIGGLIGATNGNRIIVCYSYFQAGIISSARYDETNSKVLLDERKIGLLIADDRFVSDSWINHAYAIGIINLIYEKDGQNVISNLEDFGNSLISTNTFNVINDTDAEALGVSINIEDANNLQKSGEIANCTVINVYGVVNSNSYFFSKSNKLIAMKDSKPLVGSESNRILPFDNSFELFKSIGFSDLVLDGETATANDNWVINDEVNKVNGVPFPVLLTKASATNTPRTALYDLVPTKILFDRVNSSAGLFDISTSDSVQLLMFLNAKSGVAQNSFFTIEKDSKTSNISIKFEGATIETNFFVINSELEYLENQNGQVISIVGNKVYPLKTGVVTLTIRSLLDKTVSLDIVIKVIKGITDIELSPVQNVNYDEDGETPVVYIDEVSYFEFSNINQIGGVNYDSSKEFGYMLEVLPSTGHISLNGVTYSYNADEGANNTYYISTSSIVAKGVKIGKVEFKITPIVFINELNHETNNYIVLDSISRVVTFKVNSRARDIKVSKEDVTIAPKNTTNFVITIETSNLEIDETNNTIEFLSPIDVFVNGQKYVIDVTTKKFSFEKVGSVYNLKGFGFDINYELIKMTFNSCSVSLTDTDILNSKNTYNVSIGALVSFNTYYYRTHADEFDLNTISYTYRFTPRSNSSVSDSVVVYISPNVLNSIFTNYYSRGELLSDESEKYANENESRTIVPGEKGLLKITLDEEFNDSSYITVTLDNGYQDYVSLTQMAGQVNGYVVDDGAVTDLTDYIDSYKEILFKQSIGSESEYGIRLSKLTLNYNEQNYFNKTYFVKLALNRSYGDLTEVRLVITSYKVDRNSVTATKTQVLTLGVAQLPLIDVKVDDAHSAYLGKGVKKELQVNYRGITSEIDFGTLKNGLSIQDEDGQSVNYLSIDYLESGKKYYLCAELTSEIKLNIIKFKAEEIVLGVRETNLSDLAIQIVEFEVEDITLEGMIDGVVTIKHGQNFAINTSITYKKPTIGTPEAIQNFEKGLRANNFGPVSLAEYAGGGQIVTKSTYKNNSYVSNQTVAQGQLRLGYLTYVNGDKVWATVDMQNNDYNYVRLGENVLELPYTQNSSEYDIYTINYYTIKGVGITGDYNLVMKLTVPYYYNDQGGLVVNSDSIRYTTKEIEFRLIVEDSSTYDHPNPIETQEDLLKACTTGTGDYILLNNITLTNWVPQDVNFKSLDGNGYIIKLNSFNLNSKRGEDNADVGIFSTVSQNTLLKNITVDVSEMLITENEMLNQVSTLLNSTEDTYDATKANFDMSYTTGVNFGILAGTNNGSITNAKIISTNNTNSVEDSTKMYLHIVTSQGYIENTFVNTNIGGIVGVNSSTGAITNSFVGLSLPNMTVQNSQILAVKNPSKLTYNNSDDSLENIKIYPFILAGGNKLGGVVSENNGIVSNTYAKGLGLYNTYPAVTDSQTGGLVATNNSIITSSFVEGKSIQGYRSESSSKFIIESTGNVGGLVFNNNGTIENSYSNAYLETQSAFTGGFVYSNNANGVIVNSYSTAVNKNSLAHGQFTGIAKDGNSILNAGSYSNCYYMVLDGENVNQLEVATAIVSSSENSTIDNRNSWRGFSFASDANAEGIWVISQDTAPRIASSLNDTTSFRKLTEITESTIENSQDGSQETITITVYNYEYITNILGSLNNPLIIDKAENFDKYIIDNTIKIPSDSRQIFGATSSTGNAITNTNVVRYVRLVNNLDFEKITTAQKHKNTYLYKTVFAGVLDGNGMSLNNLNINTDDVQLDDFGLFAQVGIEKEYSTLQTVIKNLNLNLRTYKSSDSSRAGVLAGTIINSNIINVKIDGGSSSNSSAIIGARNMAGALAGLIYADNEVSLIDITVSNVSIEATYGSLGGEITNDSKDTSNGFYKQFNIKNVETNTEVNRGFNGLYDLTSKSTKLYIGQKIRTDVSYAGSVAGVIIANNSSATVDMTSDYTNYQTKPDSSSIDSVVVKDSITIRTADNSGGLFGYVGENTLIKNSYLLLSNNQIIRAFNYAGGIVAENHGIIEQCYVALSDNGQTDIDNNIMSIDRGNDIQLFDTIGSTDYTVAIGGIAGYSSNGVIIDSYSKVNVTKPYAYIAGGLVGYSEDYNYIAYSFATGAVYSKFVTGGIVGLQVNRFVQGAENHKSLKMYHTYALTDWNYSSDGINTRQSITNRLYENQKSLYKLSDGSYYSFYVKMPEVGNLDIIGNVSLNGNYLNDHNDFYVGSAIGYTIINDSSDNSVMRKDNEPKLITSDKLTNYYNTDTNKFVVTNTFGLMSTSGSLASGNKQDSYNNLTFSYAVDSENTINMHSYRIAYNSVLNEYEYKSYIEKYIEVGEGNTYTVVDNQVTIGSDTYTVVGNQVTIGADVYEVKVRNLANQTNVYYDVFSYPQLFNQEYLEQMIGSYSQIVDSANKSTASVFRYTFDAEDRFATNDNNNAFVTNKNSYIWNLDKYLPKYSYGLYQENSIISDAKELGIALTTISSGRIYSVVPSSTSYDISLDVNANNHVFYNNTIKNTFLGKLNEDNTKPTIKFTIKDGSKVNALFNLLSGVTLYNIDFEIIVENTSSLNSARNYANSGIIANIIQNSTITNCSFKLELGNVNLDDNMGESFKSNNVGLMFGSIINSTIENCSCEISTGAVTLNASEIENFGLFAGYMSNTSYKNNKVKINNESSVNIQIAKASSSQYDDEQGKPQTKYETLNIGGFVGVVNSSKIVFKTNTDMNISDTTITNKCNFDTLNVSQLIGYAGNANISKIQLSSGLIVKSDTIKSDTSKSIRDLNIAKIVAMSKSTNITDIGILGAMTITGLSDGQKAPSVAINIAGIIGQDLKSSYVADAAVTSTITANINSITSSIGGLIGLSQGSSNLVSKSKFSGEISIENTAGGITDPVKGQIYYAKTYVGGVLGSVTGAVQLDNILSDGKLTIKTNQNLCEVAVGGVVGYSKSNVTLNDFASYAVFELKTGYENSNSNVYVSGVLGLNNGIFGGQNGFTLVELPKSAGVNTSAITNNSVSGATSNIFYASELMGTDYDSDSKFNYYALADVYDSISKYADVNVLNGAQNLKAIAAGKLKVFVPNCFENETIPDADTRAVFNPDELDSTLSNLGGKEYYVVIKDIKTTGVTGETAATNRTLEKNQVISGRTTKKGKVEITTTNANGANETLYVFSRNLGIISNIYFKTTNNTSTPQNPEGQNVALVNENKGTIVGVYAYGVTENSYSIANTNSGKILKSASSTVYKFTKPDKTSTYGLVNTNTENGEIYDVYSSGFVYSVKATTNSVYGIANQNLGKISYAFYYIPEIMDYNNSARGIVATNKVEGSDVSGSTYRCENSSNPSFAKTRSTIWTSENGHTQLIGVKDIEGAILVKLVMLMGDERTYDLSTIKTNISSGNSNYKFDYEINFYSSEKLSYNLIRFNSGAKFANYINSLSTKYIPQNTIIMLDGSNDDKNTLKISSNIESFSLYSNAMLIGRYFNNKNLKLEFTSSSALTHELIYENRGIIAGITFKTFKFVNQNNALTYFAPILNNIGYIYCVNFESVNVDGGAVGYVAGILAINNGRLDVCSIDSYKITSVGYYNNICSVNNRESQGCTAGSGSAIGSKNYYSGING